MCESCNDNEESVYLPEDQLTKSQKEFIGTTFPTPKGGTLTVKGIVGKQGGNAMFGLECSICSKDKGLWPIGSIKSIKDSLVRKSCPCGCAKNTMWTEKQQSVRVERECNKKGYIFHGWYGDYNNTCTKLDLSNPETGSRWQSTSINKFLKGRGDPLVGADKKRQSSLISDYEHKRDFIASGFSGGYSFWRNTERKGKSGRLFYWNYTCPVCSNDEYVQAGVCSGVFTSTGSSLKKGIKSCRCGSYNWSKDQREYQIIKTCNKEGLTFIGWSKEEGYKNSTSKFKWMCKKGHNCETSVGSFLNDGHRCRTCRNKENGRGNGYYPNRVKDQDSLYIIKSKEWIKCGRSFDHHKRLKEVQRAYKESCEIYCIFTADHQAVYDLEQKIKDIMYEEGLNFYEGDGYESVWAGSTECYQLSALDYIKELIDESDLKLVEENT